MKKLLRGFSLPKQLLLVIIASLLLGDLIPLELKRVLFTSSLVIKSALIFTLPFIVFSCIFSSVLEMQLKGAISIVGAILVGICFSNLSSTWVAFSMSKVFFVSGIHSIANSSDSASALTPLFSFNLQPWLSNDKALLLGLLVGILSKVWKKKEQDFARLAISLRTAAYFILNRLFVPSIPLFVLGFALKLQHDRVLFLTLKEYSAVFGLVSLILLFYLGFLYWLGSGFHFQRFKGFIQTVIPSVVSGFSTMSSMAALPLTLKAAEKNTQDSQISRMVVPMTVNNHLVGDSIFIPYIGIALISSAHPGGLQIGQFLEFSFYFVMAKFAVAAVPGGGIMVMLPILDKYLGLSAEMLSLITTLYVLFDPVITAANVAGNGAFSILIARLVRTSRRGAQLELT
jgi:Na+/H+-dicarboxylate symporter